MIEIGSSHYKQDNPTKTELGKISKQKLSKIVSVVKSKTNLNQWKNTQSVIRWFMDIPRKGRTTFIQFDICDFYPLISEDLLRSAMDYAAGFVEISEDVKKIILHTKQSMLYSKRIPWEKKGDKSFDERGFIQR